MKNIIFCSILFILVLASCGSTKLESGLQKIEIGMTKEQVISILGKSYIIMGAGSSPDGNLETWSYSDPNVMEDPNKRIIVNFLDGRLDEWHREYLPPKPPVYSYSNNNQD